MHSRLLLFQVSSKQVDVKARFSFGHVLSLHAAHQASQQVQLLFSQQVGSVVCLQQVRRGVHTKVLHGEK